VDVLLRIVLGLIASIALIIVSVVLIYLIIAWRSKFKVLVVIVVIGCFAGWLIWYLVQNWQTVLASLFILVAIVFGLFWLLSGGWGRETRRVKKLKDWTGQDYEDFWDERDED